MAARFDFHFAIPKNVKINMEQLFAVQINPFLEGAPRGCERHGNLIKRKAWGGSPGALNCIMCSQGAKNFPRPHVSQGFREVRNVADSVPEKHEFGLQLAAPY